MLARALDLGDAEDLAMPALRCEGDCPIAGHRC
jgi:hypothetical protein